MTEAAGINEASKKGGGIPRRTVLGGLAWSVPILAAASAVPLAAASTAGYTLRLTSLEVAPNAAFTGEGNQGEQALLGVNRTFNTFGVIRNEGPDAAPYIRAQVTFDQDATQNNFSVNQPWIITSVGVNEGLGRWMVNLEYPLEVAADTAAPQLIVGAYTRGAAAFPVGQSGAYQVLGRAMAASGGVENDLSDYFYVSR